MMERKRLPVLQKGLTLHLVGLGDVGGTLLTGLVLLGGMVDTIGIYDPDEKRVARYEQEMNQILPADGHKPLVVPLAPEALFTGCDGFVFAASAGVPPVGSGVADVRMAQYEKNRSILAPYGQLAAKKGYDGLFFQVSDPVDRLCYTAAGQGVQRDRIIGCGLGVMLARSDYCARKRGVTDFLCKGRVYGPHGDGLVVANDRGDGYDDALSRALTQEVLSANLAVRETGYKPYIAPGLSSGCMTILRALRGDWFDATVYRDGLFMGCRARLTDRGIAPEPWPTSAALLSRIQTTAEAMRAWITD